MLGIRHPSLLLTRYAVTRFGQRVLTIALLTPILLLALGSYEAPEESAEERAERIERECATGKRAIDYAELIVRSQMLGSPSFRRSERRSRKIGDCEYMVFGAVEGDNAFGGRIINYYVVRMEGRVSLGGIEWYNSPPIMDANYTLMHQLYLHDRTLGSD